MRRVWNVVLLGTSLIASGSANAQSWGVYVGTGGGYPGYQRGYDDEDGLARFICSGQRAHMLEDRLRHEVAEDEIDGDDADRIHAAIDRLEDRQRHECREGDRRAIGDIAYRYDRIARWIDGEAHRGW
ncbi:histidine kinase [Sphingomonas sp.]|uniref:histidine kinase n=1 Tax=Sphingomonas sp. TaxID=28214 RepID=UPI0025FADD92|nr:histidine kinase [Sphingomonas sp.]